MMDHVVLDHQVFIDEFTPVSVIGNHAAHLGGGQDHIFGLLLLKKGLR